MKKLFLILVLIATNPLSAADRLIDKLRKFHKTSQWGDPETPKPKPFDNSKWDRVYISSDGKSVYIDNNKSIKKWNFEGSDNTLIHNVSTKRHVQFTDDYCYDRDEQKIYQYSMNDQSVKRFEMRHQCQSNVSSKAGFAALTGTYVTRFTPQGTPDHSPLNINKSPAYIGLLDSGELFYVIGQQLYLVAPEKVTENEIKTQRNNLRKILKKMTSNSQLVIAYDHASVANRAFIDFINTKGETTSSIPSIETDMFPLDWDLQNNYLATDGNCNDRRTIKLFDITTGQQIYETNPKVGETAALRLDPSGNTIYTVGNKPAPESLIIDVRQKSQQQQQ